jgi:O-antigen ligase
VLIIAAATLAFGAVYPWAYVPLFCAAALIGLAGLLRGGLRREQRSLAAALTCVSLAVAIQLIPLPGTLVETISPSTAAILRNYSLLFANDAAGSVPLSINPRSTQVALLGLAALSIYMLGLPSLVARHGIRSFPSALAVFAVPLALYGIYTREANSTGLVYGFWRSVEGGGADLAGPFINRNHFAGWMLMTLCLLIGWLFGKLERVAPAEGAHAGRRRLHWMSSPEANVILLGGLSIVVVAVALFWVISRSSIVAFTAASCGFAWLVLTRHQLAASRRKAVLVLLAVALLAGVAWRGPGILMSRFQDERNLVGRIAAWKDGVAVFRDFPVFGTGLNTYADAMLFYQTGNRGQYMSRAHNDYVQVLAEGGLIVVVPAAWALLLLVRAVRRNVRAARGESRGYWIRAGAAIGLAAMGVQEVFEFSLQIPANAFLFATLGGIALAPVSARPSSASKPRGNIDSEEGMSRVALS